MSDMEVDEWRQITAEIEAMIIVIDSMSSRLQGHDEAVMLSNLKELRQDLRMPLYTRKSVTLLKYQVHAIFIKVSTLVGF